VGRSCSESGSWPVGWDCGCAVLGVDVVGVEEGKDRGMRLYFVLLLLLGWTSASSSLRKCGIYGVCGS